MPPLLPVNAADQAMREVQDFMKNLQMATTDQAQTTEKPRKNRPRHKKRNKEKVTSELGEAGSSQSGDTTDNGPFVGNCEIRNRFFTNIDQQSPVGKNEPFFPNNKKGSP